MIEDTLNDSAGPAAEVAPKIDTTSGAVNIANNQDSAPAGQDDTAAAAEGGDNKAADTADKDAGAADKPPANTFPENWRQILASGDDKEMATLERFKSPHDLLKSYSELRRAINSGEYVKPLAADATPEQVEKWRKANGVPADPMDYLKDLPEGFVAGEAEQVVLEEFVKQMHSTNAKPEVVHTALQAHNAYVEARTIAIQEKDAEFAQATSEQLKEEWGPDYTENLNIARQVMDKYFDSDLVKTMYDTARFGDQVPLMHSPEFLRGLVNMGRVYNSSGKYLDARDANPQHNLDNMIKEYEGRMGTKAWYSDTKAQEHYRQLIEIRDGAKNK